MIPVQFGALMLGVYCLFASATPEPGPVDTVSLKHIANVSYAENSNLSNIASIFSPRMDFDQWKPLTGRGDPLRNDPTYDYEPPVLERVHYWADDTRLEREHYPERKSEVLMLGVSSRKPSVSPRHPSSPRRQHRPPLHKYEDYSYKISDHYPMTILVPPPPPLPGHKPPLYILNDKPVMPNPQIKITSPPKFMKDTTSTTIPEKLTSLYTLQESNLIYQSSTTSQSSVFDSNQTQSLPNRAVSSDYAGWGPTTPFDEIEADNDKHNLIFSDHLDLPKQPYSFYKPMLSEAPPPPRVTQNPLLLPTFVPTALPPSPVRTTTTISTTQPTWPTQPTTTETTDIFDYNEETTTDTNTAFPTTPVGTSRPQSNQSILDMMTSMMSMPMANGPERAEDHLYAHASENLHIYKELSTEDALKLETMQTMQPPPPIAAGNKHTESTTLSHKPSSLTRTPILHKKPMSHLDPYLHMRFTTPMPTVASSEIIKLTTEAPTVPMYLIIQGHSKVKTYGSKPTPIDENDAINNEISKQTDNNEVKHLHPLKERYSSQKTEKGTIRRSKAQNLSSLVNEGRGSIEIQETDVGIKYDVSDGSEVPVEIYRKGIVDNDENDYAKSKKVTKEKRTKRQLGIDSIDDVLPFDEDKLEKLVYNFLKGRRNETGITGVIAQAITGSTGELLDDIEEDDDDDADDDEDDDEQR